MAKIVAGCSSETDDTPSGAIHTCDVCGKQDVWTESWVQWGSILAADSYGHQLKFCSDNCKDMVDPEALWKRKYGVAADHKQYR
jgi:hypothetical protein